MTRREMLATAGGMLALPPFQVNGAAKNSVLGAAPTGFLARNRANAQAKPPIDFVDHCHNLGLGVVETRLNLSDPEAVKKFRQKLDSYQMRAILDFPLPRTPGDVAVYDANVKAAKEAGVYTLHAAMTQRRYEQYPTFDAFKTDFERCQRTIEMAEPILRKHRVKLAIENHKGWRAGEQAAWMKRVASEWVAVHFDFGNNLALCEPPMQTLTALLPFTIACHLKDMALEMYDDGFLLSEVPVGEGILDLNKMVAMIRAKDPNIPFDLETITRDPLKIPVFTEKYWATFDDSYSPLPARDLAKTLDLVRKNHPKNPLPKTTGLTPEQQLKLEDENNASSIRYSREQLGLA